MAGKIVNCPECGSPLLRWSRRSIWERPLRLLFLRPYRCRSCRSRAYTFTWRLFTRRGVRLGDKAIASGTRGAFDRQVKVTLSNPSGTASMPVRELLVGLREGEHGLLSEVRAADLQSDQT